MSNRGSRSPNIDAIESRALDNVEHARLIRARFAAEAIAMTERRVAAGMMGSLALNNLDEGKPLPRAHGSNLGERAKRSVARVYAIDDTNAVRVSRDPCPKCGVRADLHDKLGCKRWRGW